MGQTAKAEQAGRSRQRRARFDRARARRLQVAKDGQARDARIDERWPDVYVAQEQRDAASAAVEAAERAMAEAVRRILAEKVPLHEAAKLCEMTVSQLQRLKAVGRGAPRRPVGAESVGADTPAEAAAAERTTDLLTDDSGSSGADGSSVTATSVDAGA
jgi:hypothetical protein